MWGSELEFKSAWEREMEREEEETIMEGRAILEARKASCFKRSGRVVYGMGGVPMACSEREYRSL